MLLSTNHMRAFFLFQSFNSFSVICDRETDNEKRIKNTDDFKLIPVTDDPFTNDIHITETVKNLFMICHLNKIYSNNEQLCVKLTSVYFLQLCQFISDVI